MILLKALFLIALAVIAVVGLVNFPDPPVPEWRVLHPDDEDEDE